MNCKTVDLDGCKHWSQELPYRAVVPIRMQSAGGPMLYQIAGSSQNPCGAENALRAAMKLHGGQCFYCRLSIADKAETNLWTLDHVEPTALGGKDHLGNLVVACKGCNLRKGHKPIDSFNPTASIEWLKSLQKQVQRRLAKLTPAKPNQPPSLPQPSQGAAAGL
jgi:5-methylcytosine-specific restriction endonuclease McrA